MNAFLPTTEEHRPPSAGDTGHGRPVLLAAFPALAAITIPASDEVVGRAWLAAAGVADTEVSGQHVRFFHAEGRLQIEDVRSRNGMYIGGARICAGERASLKDGDILRLGRTLLVYREAFTGNLAPEPPLGRLVGPWGLTSVREALVALAKRPDGNVLLEGETGTGKELLADAVVEALGRDVKRLTRINVAAISAGLFEGQLFGSKKGAYSGAVEDRRGVLRAHQGGAVFLDEIGELPPEVQPKILRLLENREILPVGEDRPVQVEVALIAATNQPLEDMVEQGTFRRDLLARFLVRIELPPLRNRPEDIFAILQELRARRGAAFDPKTAEVEAVERLMLEEWPANVRGLEFLATNIDMEAPLTLRVIERVLGSRAAAAQGDLGQPEDLPVRVHEAQREAEAAAAMGAVPTSVAAPPQPASEAQTVPGGVDATLQQYEASLYEGALRQTNWDPAEAARLLGKSLRTVVRKMKAFRLKPPKR